MRYLIVRDRFSKWALPVQVVGLAIIAAGFAVIFAASAGVGVAIAAIGAVVWNAGSFSNQWAPVYRRLSTTPARSIMTTRRILLPARWTVARAQRELAAAQDAAFVVTMQDGRESGIALPDQLLAVSRSEAPYLPLACLARPIADGVREDDSLLDVLSQLRRSRRDYVGVLDRLERVVGIVTSQDVKRLAASRHETPAVASRPAEPILKKAA